jgi:hypothetical protein
MQIDFGKRCHALLEILLWKLNYNFNELPGWIGVALGVLSVYLGVTYLGSENHGMC